MAIFCVSMFINIETYLTLAGCFFYFCKKYLFEKIWIQNHFLKSLKNSLIY